MAADPIVDPAETRALDALARVHGLVVAAQAEADRVARRDDTPERLATVAGDIADDCERARARYVTGQRR